MPTCLSHTREQSDMTKRLNNNKWNRKCSAFFLSMRFGVKDQSSCPNRIAMVIFFKISDSEKI